MNIKQLCIYLEREFDFLGDLQASDNVCKDSAVRHYLKEFACLDEYFPEQIGNRKKLIDLLYTDPEGFFFEWANQVQHAGVGEDLLKDICFTSQVLDGSCFDHFKSGNKAEFAVSIGDSFYLAAEDYLQEKLADEYDSRNFERAMEKAEYERELLMETFAPMRVAK